MIGVIAILFAIWLSWKIGFGLFSSIDKKIAKITGSLAAGGINGLIRGSIKGTLSGSKGIGSRIGKSIKNRKNKSNNNKSIKSLSKKEKQEGKQNQQHLDNDKVKDQINEIKNKNHNEIDEKIVEKDILDKKEHIMEEKEDVLEKQGHIADKTAHITPKTEKGMDNDGNKNNTVVTKNTTINNNIKNEPDIKKQASDKEIIKTLKAILGKDIKSNEKIILTDVQKQNKKLVTLVDSFHKKQQPINSQKTIQQPEVKEKIIIKEVKEIKEKKGANKEKIPSKNKIISPSIEKKTNLKPSDGLNISKDDDNDRTVNNNITVNIKGEKDKGVNEESLKKQLHKALTEQKNANPIHLKIINDGLFNNGNIKLNEIASRYRDINNQQKRDSMVYMQTKRAMQNIELLQKSNYLSSQNNLVNKSQLSKLLSMKESQIQMLINKR